jgi:hypothetical protein
MSKSLRYIIDQNRHAPHGPKWKAGVLAGPPGGYRLSDTARGSAPVPPGRGLP